MPASPAQLEKTIGHRFANVSILEKALTHRSWVFENGISDETDNDNESLEFIGDAVLGLVTAERLLKDHPNAGEGKLTLMKHRLVSTATLASIGESIDIGSYLKMGRGEERSGGRQKNALLANTVEAVIGAVFSDAGYVTARSVIERLLGKEFAAADPATAIDLKTRLQELLQARKQTPPEYTVVETKGPPHDRTFYVEAKWHGGTSRGHGTSRKSAEMMAAGEALKTLEI